MTYFCYWETKYRPIGKPLREKLHNHDNIKKNCNEYIMYRDFHLHFLCLIIIVGLYQKDFCLFPVGLMTVNGSQLAKMKKSIPGMSLP